MEPRFFSILGLAPTREHDRSGLNDARSHRDDESWTLGEVPDSLVAAFRGPRSDVTSVRPQRAARECPGDVVHSAS